MDDHFDTSGVFEISKFDISKFACSSILQSEKINCRENVHEDKNGKMNSLEKKFVYSIE